MGGIPKRMTRGHLIRQALSQRADCDEEWGRGWWLRLVGYEFGPFLPRTWRWAVAAKTALCVLLGLVDNRTSWRVDYVTLAMWNVDQHNGYPDCNYWHSWDELKVRKGWRPSSWRFTAGMESN